MIKKYYDYKPVSGNITHKVYSITRTNNGYDIIRLTGVNVKPFTMVNDEFIHSTIQDVFKTKIHINKLIDSGKNNLLELENTYNDLTLKATELNVNINIALTDKVSFRMLLQIGKVLENCDYWCKKISLWEKHKRINNLLIVYAIKNRIKGN